jgi:hypothetical protein
MTRLPAPVVLAALLSWICAPALAAEKLKPLDAEFLEYLASFEGDEEGWEWFADEEPAAAKPAPPAKDKEDAAKPAEKR